MIQERDFRPAKNFARLSILIITAICFLAVLPGIWRAPASSSSNASSTGKAMVSVGVPQSPMLSATKVDSLSIDNGNTGIADPGDRIKYSIDIANTGMGDALNFSFTDTIDSNTTLVPNSLMVTPLAVDDDYMNVIGNTRFEATTINTGLLGNDFDPDNLAAVLGTDLVVKAGSVTRTGGTVTGNGALNVAADGTFTYDPPVGETGTEVFEYTITDNDALDSVVTGTVTFTINEIVWYVDNTAPGGGDGRSATPFNTLTPLNGAGGAGDADAPGHIIFVFQGSGSYGGGIELEMNQRLIGQGVDLVVDPGSGPITLVNATSKPTVTNSAGNGVTLASGNTVRGLIAETTAAGGASAGVSGANVGNLNIDTVMAMGNPGAGVDIQTAGTLAITFQSISSDSGTRGVRLTNVGGGSFTSNSTTVTNGAGDGVLLQSNTGTFNFNNSLSITTGSGRGMFVDTSGTVNIVSGSTVNATGGAAVDVSSTAVSMPFSSLTSTNSAVNGVRLNSVSGSFSVSGTTSVQNSAGDGVLLLNNTVPTIGFNTLNIGNMTSVSGRGLVSTNNGTVNVTGGSITTNGATANANRAAVDISNTMVGMTFSSLSSRNSNAQGVNMNGVSGSFAVTGTTTIGNPSGIGIQVQNSVLGSGIGFGNTGVNGSGNTGVFLNNNSGNVGFGDLDITPDANQRGLLATNNIATSGMIMSTSGTIDTPAATAVEITRNNGMNTTPLNVTLTTVMSVGGSVSGIVLQNTSGSFTVTGDGESDGPGLLDDNNGSGGTISNKVGDGSGTGNGTDGVFLNNVSNVSINYMNIDSNNRNGIFGMGVNGFMLGHCNIRMNANQVTPDEAGLHLLELIGSNMAGSNPTSITNTLVSNSFENNVKIQNSTGTLTEFLVNDSTFSNNGASTQAGNQFLFVSTGSTMTIAVDTCTFTGNTTTGTLTASAFKADASAGIIDATVTNNNFMNNNVGVDLGISTNGSITFDVSNNPVITGNRAIGITVFANASTTAGQTMQGRLVNNVIGTQGVADSGSRLGSGISISNEGSGSMTVLVDDNQVNDVGTGAGLTAFESMIVSENVNAGTSNVTITDNIFRNNPDDRGLQVQCLSTGSMCSDISGNQFINITGQPTPLRVRQTAGTHNVRQQSPTAAAVAAELDDANGLTNTQVAVAGTINFNQGACTQPTLMAASAGSEGSGKDILLASGGEGPEGKRIAELERRDLSSIIFAAIERWTVTGISNEDRMRLEAVGFEIEDLPDNQLVTVSENSVLIDKTAAGHGWFIDTTPQEDFEFETAVTATEHKAGEISPAYGRIDLFTAVVRALGYVLHSGKAEAETQGNLMTRTLPTGVRRMPEIKTGKAVESEPRRDGIRAESSTDRNAPAFGFSLGDFAKTLAYTMASLPSWTSNSNLSAITKPVSYVASRFSPSTAKALTETDISKPSSKLGRAAKFADAMSGISRGDKKLRGRRDARTAISRIENVASAASATRPGEVAVKAVRGNALARPVNGYIERAEYASMSSGGTSATAAPAAGETVNLGPFTLPGGKAINIMFEVDINAMITPLGTTQVCNQGEAGAEDISSVLTDDPDVGGMTDPTCTTLASADIAITGKTDNPDPVFAGSNITYTIDFQNNGPNASSTVTVTDTVPANTTFVSATAPAGWSTSTPAVGGTGDVVFSKASVANGEMAQFQIVVMVDGATPDSTTITNTATAAAGTPDPTPGNNSAAAMTTVLSQADLSLTKSDSPDPVVIGQNITYTIDLNNGGAGNASNVMVTDDVPANTTFVSATAPAGWTAMTPAVGATGQIKFSKALVANSEMAQFQIVVMVDAGASCGTTITNTATAMSDTPDPNTGNNTATAMTSTNAPPMITCPANITVNNDAGTCGASVMFNVTGSGCPAPTIECKIGAMVITSPHTFPVGVTTVDCTASNGIMPDATCSFTVTVNDAQPPTINCPLPIVRSNDGGQCSAVVNFTATASDNCPIGTPVCTPPSGSSFPVGTTTVNCTVTDQGGNQANCSFSVTVNDTENPTITCPANITVTTGGAGTGTVIVNYPAPMTADNCGVANVVCNPPSGSMFPLGATTVTCTVTDTSNNTAQCSFTVSTFDVCIESDTDPGNGLLFISTGPLAGTYQICCGGQTVTGKGTISNKNGVIGLTHLTPQWRVQAFLYMNLQRGTASLQMPPSAFPCLITDSNVNNNSCSCSAP